MNIPILLPTVYSIGQPWDYKVHLASWNGKDQPLDVFIRSRIANRIDIEHHRKWSDRPSHQAPRAGFSHATQSNRGRPLFEPRETREDVLNPILIIGPMEREHVARSHGDW